MSPRAWRPKSRRWRVAPAYSGADELARQIGSVPLVAQILHNRGIELPEAARAFLNPKLDDLHPPEKLPGATAAAERIARAVAEGQRIVIYGDYDVDGITAVAILHTCLTMLGADVHYYVPHRLEEGYGVNIEAIRKIISRGVRLLITVDCGIAAQEPIAEAVAAGVDVVVTDHHSPPEVLPPAFAIVHPAIPQGVYPDDGLAGAGVAFKLAWQLAKVACGNTRVDKQMRDFLLDATCLAALGTIADVVPLVGENRVLAVYGLRALPATSHRGLRALLESAGLATGRLDAYHVGFVLAPRLNACGRMGHARLAVELLTTASEQRSRQIAGYLAQQNTERQKVEREITRQAVEMVSSQGMDEKSCRGIVLASEAWHGGVIGIVASRLVDQFGRPTVLIAKNGTGCAQGSARSIPGFHMREAMAACSEHLISFGGHAMAGGMRIREEKIDEFTAAFLAYAARNLTDAQLESTLRIDAETTLSAMSYSVVEHISRLAPFGEGNPRPVLAFRRCRLLVPPKRMGRSGQTVGLILGQNDARARAVGFGMGDLADHLVGIHQVDVAAEPVLNTFAGTTTVELKLHDILWD